LKGLPRSEVAEEVDRIVEAIGLAHKRYAPAKSLSGGMKRKLSVGIALIAGSRVGLFSKNIESSLCRPLRCTQVWLKRQQMFHYTL